MSQAGNFFTSGGGSGGITSVDTDNGVATPVGGILNIVADNAALNAGSSVLFTGSGDTVLLNVTDAGFNTIVGKNSGNLTMIGVDNTIFGSTSGFSLTSGSTNIVFGEGSLGFLTTGNNNVVLGDGTAANYTSNESSNILIGSNISGINGESNTLRIGSGTGTGISEINQTFISGIDGVDVGSVATVVTENNDQLGTAVITAGDGIAVTSAANTITISSTGLFFNYINVNTSPYIVLDSDVYLSVDCSGGPITILLPDLAILGEPYIIKDRTGSAVTNDINVSTVSGIVLIDGVNSFVMDSAYQSISVVGNGSTYEIY